MAEARLHLEAGTTIRRARMAVRDLATHRGRCRLPGIPDPRVVTDIHVEAHQWDLTGDRVGADHLVMARHVVAQCQGPPITVVARRWGLTEVLAVVEDPPATAAHVVDRQHLPITVVEVEAPRVAVQVEAADDPAVGEETRAAVTRAVEDVDKAWITYQL